jgi:hypothetical protein
MFYFVSLSIFGLGGLGGRRRSLSFLNSALLNGSSGVATSGGTSNRNLLHLAFALANGLFLLLDVTLDGADLLLNLLVTSATTRALGELALVSAKTSLVLSLALTSTTNLSLQLSALGHLANTSLSADLFHLKQERREEKQRNKSTNKTHLANALANGLLLLLDVTLDLADLSLNLLVTSATTSAL